MDSSDAISFHGRTSVSRARYALGVVARLVRVLPDPRRRQLTGLCALMLLSAFAEIVSLGALIPFLGLLAAPGSHAGTGRIRTWLSSQLGLPIEQAILPVTIAFAALICIAAAVRVALNVSLARTNFRTGHEIGSLIYRYALLQPFEYHTRHHSADIVGGVVKVDTAIFVLMAVLVGVSSSFIALCIGITLFVISPGAALVAVAGFGGTYALVSRAIQSRLLANGRVVNTATPNRLQAMQEGLGGIRDVILDHTQDFHQARFDRIDAALRRAQESNQILGPTPRYVIEAIGMIVIAGLGCWYSLRGEGVAAALPTLGVLVLGGQRLLPLLQQAYHGWVMLAGHLAVIEDVSELLQSARAMPVEAPESDKLRLPFAQRIAFENVWFRFAGTETHILRDLSFEIPAGARVGIVGPTGGGKSTMLNVLMGLLEPTAGAVSIDGVHLDSRLARQWQRNVAHVPQSIFLADASISENVAFGVPKEWIDTEAIRDVLRRARLTDFVNTLPYGLQTTVGENGVRLSGGQRQRLGIARALYKKASVLVLDEATSALDESTEAEIMQSVESLGRDITLVMIAHRLTTLASCDFVLQVQDGRVTRLDDHPALRRAGPMTASP